MFLQSIRIGAIFISLFLSFFNTVINYRFTSLHFIKKICICINYFYILLSSVYTEFIVMNEFIMFKINTKIFSILLFP